MSETRKLLVIEDSPMMRSLYRSVLGETTDTLLFAEDGVEGLDRAAQEPDIGLYIVDINLPRLDGLAFVRRLREELGVASPVLVVSTECEAADREAAAKAGADGYLCKPWEPEDLRTALAALAAEGA
jgi:two-component system chemotaxis response regulator CheY